MFASPVNPLYGNLAFTAEERCLNDMAAMDRQHWQHHMYHQQQYNQRLGHEQQDASQSNERQQRMERRKRSLHFEPEFLEALDSSLQESPTAILSRSRPQKRARRRYVDVQSSTEQELTNTNRTTPAILVDKAASTASTRRTRSSSESSSSSRSSSDSSSEGPSIIDLGSGEKLVALHLGENDHKRRWDSLADSGSSTESLREVFDVLEDGTLRAVMDHAPSLPSPMKRPRADKSAENVIHLLDEKETDWRHHQQAYDKARRTGADKRAGAETDRDRDNSSQMMDQDEWMADEGRSLETTPVTSGTGSMALVRYEGPKTMTLADGMDALIRQGWRDRAEVAVLDNVQGHELVLYRRPAPTFLTAQEADDDTQGSTHIEELHDDEDLPSYSNTEDSLHELEGKIMDMDLD
ncbi:hypothetical protein BGX28_004429 [Mortierella sp. GBA30]|nr:hypothetical protein BGX28_004429 [Mortierella sp. GBA30]